MRLRISPAIAIASVIAAAIAVFATGGCPTQSPETQAVDGPTFSSRSLANVQIDTSTRLAERRFITGLVPVAFAIEQGDNGAQFVERVAKGAQLGDCFVARPRMDWVSFGENGSGKLRDDLISAVNVARDSGMRQVLIEIDPVADRRHVGILPPELEGKNFSNPEVAQPVKRMALEIALKLRPQYLSIGVEMNGYYESNPADFMNYVALHKETYDAVKAAAPDVKVICAFNLEALQGFFGDFDQFSNHPPQWFLIDMLEPKLDAVAFSTLPFGFFIQPVLIPDDYLSRIELHTTRDILFTEIGWPGDPTSPIYTLQSQAEYVARMLRLIDKMPQARLVAWTTLFDALPESAVLVNPDFKTLGLINHLNEPKPALDVWRAVNDLPYRP